MPTEHEGLVLDEEAVPDREVVIALTKVLAKTCRRLGEAGQPQDAARLAAQGWRVLRRPYPPQALLLDGTMHHLARLEAALETPPTT